MKNFCFSLGYNPAIVRSLGAPHEKLKEIFNDFTQIRVDIFRLTENVFQVHIVIEGVPTAQQGVMTIDTTVSGMIGDIIRLTYGEKIKLVNYVPETGLEIEFIR